MKNSVEFFTPRDKSDRIFHTCEESVPGEIRFNIALMSRGNESLFVRHKTKLADTPNYVENHLKTFSSRTKGPVDLGLGMRHMGLVKFEKKMNTLGRP